MPFACNPLGSSYSKNGNARKENFSLSNHDSWGPEGSPKVIFLDCWLGASSAGATTHHLQLKLSKSFVRFL